jgi:molecular chaperone DnaJ
VSGPTHYDTHYDTLGVPPSATDGEIREAYRRLARAHHPDRASAGSTSSPLSMPEINEAYRVLGDPARRAVYDAGLRSGPSTAPSDRPPSGSSNDRGADADRAPMHPSHLGPARIPWRSLLFVGAIAVIGIVVLAQFTEPGEPAAPDGILRVGDCASVEADNSVREVACTGDQSVDLVVDAFVPFDARCPGATVAYRDRQGMGVACIATPVDAPG